MDPVVVPVAVGTVGTVGCEVGCVTTGVGIADGTVGVAETGAGVVGCCAGVVVPHDARAPKAVSAAAERMDGFMEKESIKNPWHSIENRPTDNKKTTQF